MVEDAPHDPEFRYAPLLRDHGIVSLLNAPVSVDSLVWGVLEVDSTTSRFFGPDDAWFLSALANTLGLALYGRMALQRASDAAASTANSLRQEHMLLDELRHRGKNDLQLIQAMLVMQKRGQADAQVRRGLDDVMDRIAAIGVAHDQLTPAAALDACSWRTVSGRCAVTWRRAATMLPSKRTSQRSTSRMSERCRSG